MSSIIVILDGIKVPREGFQQGWWYPMAIWRHTDCPKQYIIEILIVNNTNTQIWREKAISLIRLCFCKLNSIVEYNLFDETKYGWCWCLKNCVWMVQWTNQTFDSNLYFYFLFIYLFIFLSVFFRWAGESKDILWRLFGASKNLYKCAFFPNLLGGDRIWAQEGDYNGFVIFNCE